MVRLFLAAPLMLMLATSSAIGIGGWSVTDSPTGAPQDWRLSSSPLVVIGQADGAEAYLFNYVSSAFRLTNGDIVVASAGTSDIRIFDSAGVHKRTVGSRGDGPGESPDFSALGAVQMGGRVVPASPNNLYLFGHGGGVVEPTSPTFVTTGRPDGVHRDSSYLFVYDRAGENVSGVGPIAAGETFLREGTSVGLFFGHRLMIAAADTFFYMGTGKPYAIHAVASTGTTLRTITVPQPGPPVPREALDTSRERFLASIFGGATERDRQFVGAMPVPETMPSYSALLTDAEGNLWVEEYEWRNQPRVWAVFSIDGELLARLPVPAGLRVLSVSRTHLIALHEDELGVQRIRLYGVEN